MAAGVFNEIMPNAKNHEPHGIRWHNSGKENLDGAVHHYDPRPFESLQDTVLTGRSKPKRPLEVSEQPVLYRVLGRIGGGPWTTELVGTSPAAATFPTQKQAEGAISWFRAQRQEGSTVEYTIVPVLALRREIG